MSEYLRRAAAAFRPAEDEQALEKMIHQMNKTTVQANRALESALAFVEASNQRIATLETALEIALASGATKAARRIEKA